MGINSDRTNPAPRESGPVGQLPQCDHWHRNLRRPCVRTTAGLNSRIPAAGVSAPCRLDKTQQSKRASFYLVNFSRQGVVFPAAGATNPCRLIKCHFVHQRSRTGVNPLLPSGNQGYPIGLGWGRKNERDLAMVEDPPTDLEEVVGGT